jgi:MFS family permease
MFDGFDLTIPLILVTPVSLAFFPGDQLASLIAFYGSYLTTLLARPLGALFWGNYADKSGRKKALVSTVIGFTAATGLTGLLPTYVQAGVLAPAGYVLLRILTGFFAGGEWASGQPLSMELMRKGRISGFVQSGYPFGYLLTAAAFTGTFALLGPSQFQVLGWRIMFLFGFIPALLAIYVRRGMPESHIWEEKSKLQTLKKQPYVDLFRNHWKKFLQALMVLTGLMYCYYAVMAFYPKYLGTYLKIPGGPFGPLIMIITAWNILGYLSAGFLAEKGRKLTLLLFSSIGLVVTLPLLLYMAANPTFTTVALAGGLIAFFVVAGWGVTPIYLAERFPTTVRASGAGFVYNGGLLVGSWALIIVPSLSPFFGGGAMGVTWSLGLNTILGLSMIVAGTLLGPETSKLNME